MDGEGVILVLIYFHAPLYYNQIIAYHGKNTSRKEGLQAIFTTLSRYRYKNDKDFVNNNNNKTVIQ